QRLLAGRRFGAPELYGSVYDPARQRYWLFLEDVGEETLEQGDREEWLEAARWLARMHATYHGREAELRGPGCLEEHDAAFYHAVARAGRVNLLAAGAEAALAHFDMLMARFDEVVAALLCEPRTLVHGDIFPANLHLQPGSRIRP